MSESVQTMVDRWARASGKTQEFSATLDLLRLLAAELYHEYEPFPDKPPFLVRLATWLENVPEDVDRQALFEFVPWLLFIGSKEMKSMYRAAFAGPITQWIIDDAELDITSPRLTEEFTAAVEKTLFGGIAGMDVGRFVRLTCPSGQEHRPDFRDLAAFGGIQGLNTYLQTNGYERIVAVDDYVGTGSQMSRPATSLAQLVDYRILLCPIVVAAKGAETGRKIAAKHPGHVYFSPLWVVPTRSSITETASSETATPNEFDDLRELIIRTWPQVRGSSPESSLRNPFGFGATGSLVLTYLNCPNNVPPFVHHLSDKWNPLFQRKSR